MKTTVRILAFFLFFPNIILSKQWPSSQIISQLFLAVGHYNNPKRVQEYFDLYHISPDCRKLDFSGNTLLYEASEYENIEVVKVLLLNGADPCKSCGPLDITPLMIAARKGNVELIELLLQWGAAINHKDRCNHTALMEAVRAPGDTMLSTIQLLVHSGAWVDELGPYGYAALC